MKHLPSIVRLTLLVVCLWFLHANGSAQSLSTPAILPGDLALDPSAGVQQKAEIARGGDLYLVVWEDSRLSLTGSVSNAGMPQAQTDVYAMRFDADGNALDASPIVVSHQTFHQSDAKLAWNGSDWLVAWTSRRPTAFSTTRGIYAARVSGAGVLLDTTPILIEDSDAIDELFPAVASDGSGWAVLYQDSENGQEGAFGALVDANGVVVAHKTIGTSNLGVYIPRDARIAFAQGRYLVTTQHYAAGAPSGQFDDLFGRFFDVALDPIAPEFVIDSGPGAQHKSSIASNGAGFFVAWIFSGNAVEGTPVALDGTVLVPGGATLFAAPDTFQPRVAWDGLRWIASVDHQSGVHEIRVDGQGQVEPGSPFVLEPHAFGEPAIQDSVVAGGAGGAGRSLVVWADSRLEATDLRARTVDATGAIGPMLPLSVSAHGQHHPDLAGDLAHGYLVAFVSESAGVRRIAAQRVGGLGEIVDLEPAFLAVGGLEIGAPRVAWNGATWIVVWSERLGGAGTPIGARTFAVRFDAAGTILDPTPIDVMPGETPDVAALGDAFLVVSSDEPVNHIRYAKMMRVRASDGALLDASATIVAPSYALFPRVEALGSRWLVVWERHTTHDTPFSSIRGAFVEASGAPGPFFIAGSGPFATDSTPSLAALEGTAEIAWDDGQDVRARRVNADGTLFDDDTGVLVSSAPNDQFATAIASDGAQWVAGWNDFRIAGLLDAPLGDVFATRIDAAGSVLDRFGFPVAADPEAPEGNLAIAGDGGVTVVAYAALEYGAPFVGYRITIRSSVTSPVGNAFCFGDGSALACPCGNASSIGAGLGCTNSTGDAARLVAAGTASLADDDLTLIGTGMSPGFALYLQGTTELASGGIVLGDGVRCIGGALIRLGAKSGVGGASHHPGPAELPISVKGAVTQPGTRTYQIWYRDTASFCSADAFNLSNAIEVGWAP